MFNLSILYWDQQTSVQNRRHRNFRNSIPLIFLIFYWYYILRKEKRITLLKFHRFPFQLFFPPFKYCWWMCACVVGVCVSVSVSKYIKPLDNTVHLAPDIWLQAFGSRHLAPSIWLQTFGSRHLYFSFSFISLNGWRRLVDDALQGVEEIHFEDFEV